MSVIPRCSSSSSAKKPLCPQSGGSVPDNCVTLKFSTFRLGNAKGLAQLFGREPAKDALEMLITCRAAKLLLAAQESGRPGKLPVRVKFISVLRQPRDWHVIDEQLRGSAAVTSHWD